MRLTWFFLGVAVVMATFLLDESEAHGGWTRIFKPKVRKPSPFRVTGLFCRMKRHRIIVDENNLYVRCSRRCPNNGYSEMYSITWGHYCKPIVIPEGCLDEYCNRCLSSYKWVHSFKYESRCVKTCPKRYYEYHNECEKCFSTDCDKCSGPWTCTECKRGFALYTSPYMGSTVCLRRCVRGYVKRKMNGVMECVRRGYRTTTTTTPATTTTTEEPTTTTETTETTIPTDSTDVTITTTTTTTSIDETTKTEKAATVTTTTPTTPTTTTPTTKAPTTMTTSEPPPEGCNDLYCTECSDGYLKLITSPMGNSTCVKQCPVGYSASANNCFACADSRCGLCDASITECTKCKAGFSLMLDAANISTECVRYCPKDYIMQKINGASTCIKEQEKECPVNNCQDCFESSLISINRGCARCKPGFKLTRGTLNDHCYTSCPPGHYVITEKETNSSICARCEVLFCKKCSKRDTCDECVEPMVLDSITGKCRFCEKHTVFVYDLKKCVPVNKNKPEGRGNEIGVFGGPFVG